MMQARNSNGTAPADVFMLQDTDLPRTQSIPQPDLADTMYMYRMQGRLDGIPVAQGARGLAVSSQDQLRMALRPHADMRVYMQWLTPDTHQQLQEYQNILQGVADGNLQILQQTKQYSQSKGAFLVFVKYRYLQYTLHPRWQHLKIDNNEVQYG